MKLKFYLLCVLFCAINASSVFGQALIDMTMNNVPLGSNKLEVRIRPTQAVVSGSYSAGIFTVRYPIAVDTLKVLSSTYGYTFAPLLMGSSNDGTYKYQRFQFAQVYNVDWDACKDTLVAVLQFDNGPASVFELVTGVTWTNDHNGNFYQELDGLELQGVFYNYNTSISNVSCNGGSNGAIDLTVTGGRPAYTYDWSNGAATQDISNLTAGTYTVTITGMIELGKSLNESCLML